MLITKPTTIEMIVNVLIPWVIPWLRSWGTISLPFLLKGIHTPLMEVYHEMVDTCRCEHGTKLEVVSTVVSDRESVQGLRRCASQQIYALGPSSLLVLWYGLARFATQISGLFGVHFPIGEASGWSSSR
jgi:hypothetical protein